SGALLGWAMRAGGRPPWGTLEISSPRCGDMDGFAVTRLVIGAGFLLVAAAADVRTRKVPDPLWIGLGSIGLVVLAVELIQDQIEADAWALLGSDGLLLSAILFVVPLYEEDGIEARP